jgi:hypothetical protein
MRRLLFVCCLAAALLSACAAGSQADSVGAQVEAYFAALPSLWPEGDTSVANGSMLLHFSGDGAGVWHVVLADGRVTAGQGEIENPTVTVDMAAADWLALLKGEASPVALYMAGKLRASGDIVWSGQFQAKLKPWTPSGQGQADRVVTDTAGWYRFQPLRNDYSQRVASDASDLLDAPAGKHGFLTVKGDRFVFQDGTPIKFWGTNIVASNAFMDHEAAERVAARLARFGCNMVRFHHMDAGWAKPNIFDPAFDDTQHLSAESLDRLDYLISQLKQRGIYIYLDLLVHRKFGAGDGVMDWQTLDYGAKIAAHYDPRLIELQKKYAHDLYTHKNPYTGLRYCDDPAVAMSEIINESSLFWDAYGMLPTFYVEEINAQYGAWAKSHGGPQTSVPEGLKARDPKVLAFLYETQVAYFTGMRDYLRSIGVKVPLAGSNFWQTMALDLESNAQMDYMDRHVYWDLPQGGYDPGCRFENRPMVKSPDWNMISALTPGQAAGKPVIITEWNECWINDYMAEGPLTMAAYGAYQGWDGLLQFDYGSAPDWPDRMQGCLEVGEHPHAFATWPAAARLFRQVRPGKLLELKHPADEVAAGALFAVPGTAPALRRIAFAPAPKGEQTDLPAAVAPAVSDTGELSWDHEKGLITAHTASSAVRLGFATGPVAVGPVTFEVTPEFAVVAVSALDGKPIPNSKHLLITATARAENSGMVFAPGRKSALDPGRAPILMQPVRGWVHLQTEGNVKAWVLDPAGNRAGSAEVTRDGGAASIALASEGFWWEVEVTR